MYTTHCFVTIATMVQRTRHNVTLLYIHAPDTSSPWKELLVLIRWGARWLSV
jgi:hypothetical protein